jgi:hypothetical protein
MNAPSIAGARARLCADAEGALGCLDVLPVRSYMAGELARCQRELQPRAGVRYTAEAQEGDTLQV